MSARASLLTLPVTLGVALGAIGLAVAAPGQPRAEVAFDATGALGLTSSRDGETLFAASGMRPGGTVSGTLRVTNTGDAPEILALRTSAVDDRAGTGGGVLSTQLALTVRQVVGAAPPVPLWAGHAQDLDDARLAVLAAGETRDLVVTATLPASGTGNAYQGAGVTLGLTWGVRPVSDAVGGGAATPTPTPTVTPVVTPTPTRTPAPVLTPTRTPAPARTPVPTRPPAAPAPVVVVPVPVPAPTPPGIAEATADELGLPGANTCLSRRRIVLHLRAPHSGRVASAVVRIGRGRPVKARGRGRRIVPVKVSLRGFRQRKATVSVGVVTTDGHRYRSHRAYRLCSGR